ncbi:MAG: nucleoside phosphorylase [Anaerolineaceae bacterium]|nr:nucleoside phosphorylase [Anaerolineaceae bacterium]
MKPGEWITKKLYKWVILYPLLRKIMNWLYFKILKMPQYHLGLSGKDIGEFILLTEDPADVPRIASFLRDSREMAFHREYRTFTGLLDNQRVSVTSTGLGGPSAAIAIEELSSIGAKVFIFLGKGHQANEIIQQDDLIIAKGAIRDEGTGDHYLPQAFPAVADFQITTLLRNVCQENKIQYHVGVVYSKDAYYANNDLDQKFLAKLHENSLCMDMNSAACFIVSACIQTRMGVLLSANKPGTPVTESQIYVAIEALSRMIRQNKKIE